MSTLEKIEKVVVEGYRSIDVGVVDSYKKIEDIVVDGYKKIENSFVEKHLMKEGETVAEAKERILKKVKETDNIDAE